MPEEGAGTLDLAEALSQQYLETGSGAPSDHAVVFVGYAVHPGPAERETLKNAGYPTLPRSGMLYRR